MAAMAPARYSRGVEGDEDMLKRIRTQWSAIEEARFHGTIHGSGLAHVRPGRKIRLVEICGGQIKPTSTYIPIEDFVSNLRPEDQETATLFFDRWIAGGSLATR
jgi:hypothetical protein